LGVPQTGDISLIDEIAYYKSQRKEKVRINYSFATKFCHCHHPNLFPINDKFVRNSLFEFNKYHQFSKFTKRSLSDYQTFKNVLHDFKTFVKGDKLDYVTIDRFLWALGRDNERRNRKRNGG
jgi:hypothetical protein